MLYPFVRFERGAIHFQTDFESIGYLALRETKINYATAFELLRYGQSRKGWEPDPPSTTQQGINLLTAHLMAENCSLAVELRKPPVEVTANLHFGGLCLNSVSSSEESFSDEHANLTDFFSFRS